MMRVERYVNQLMTSNCYIVYDDQSRSCIVVDPGSQYSEREIKFIDDNGLHLDYIILTHEHSDHTWGVNTLLEQYPYTKVVALKECVEQLPLVGDMYFRFYYDDLTYHYEVDRVDVAIQKEDNKRLGPFDVYFIPTPGHSIGSMSIVINEFIFTGDTLMMYKNKISKKTGSISKLNNSIGYLKTKFSKKLMRVCPGHGDMFWLDDFDFNQIDI